MEAAKPFMISLRSHRVLLCHILLVRASPTSGYMCWEIGSLGGILELVTNDRSTEVNLWHSIQCFMVTVSVDGWVLPLSAPPTGPIVGHMPLLLPIAAQKSKSFPLPPPPQFSHVTGPCQPHAVVIHQPQGPSSLKILIPGFSSLLYHSCLLFGDFNIHKSGCSVFRVRILSSPPYQYSFPWSYPWPYIIKSCNSIITSIQSIP